MAGRKGSFACLCREQLAAHGQMTVAELAAAMITAAPDKVAGRKVRPMVQVVLRHLCRTGEAHRVASRTYQWAARKEPVQLRQKMWSILRSRRVVSLDDLMELTGATRAYARQWATMLEGHGVVRRLDDGRVQLVHDPVVMPEDEAKAARLRDLRVRKALDGVRQGLEMVIGAVKNLENEYGGQS